MAEIICRHADSDIQALQMAMGMEEASCQVFSVTHVPGAPSSLSWIVWGRFDPSETSCSEIDDRITEIMYPED